MATSRNMTRRINNFLTRLYLQIIPTEREKGLETALIVGSVMHSFIYFGGG